MSAEMFAEAVRAYQGGQRRRARDLLTRLLKAEPNNVEYWLWLSAAVDSEKEQVFCLQKAIKIDPNSEAARRGLVMLGALKPEDAALPPAPPLSAFAPNLPARQALRAAGGFLANPRNREILLIAAVSVVAVALVGALATLIFAPQVFFPPAVVVVSSTPPPSATPAPTTPPTETATVEPCHPPAEADPAQPLAAYLCLTQTPPPAPAPTANTPNEDYKSLVRAYNQGEWATVLTKAQVLANDQVLSQDASVAFFAAEAYRAQGDFKNARDSYSSALKLAPALTAAQIGKALAEFNLNQSNNALKSLEAALSADPGYVSAWLTRAEYYQAAGNLDRAVADLEQARSLAPESAEVLARLALAYAEAGRAAEAQDLAGQAVARDPGQPLGYYARGRALLSLGEAAAANTDLTLIYRYLVEPAPFRQLFPVAAALKVNDAYAARVLTALGQARAGLGDDEAARKFLDDAIARRPEDLPAAYLARGQLNARAQAVDAAVADLSSAVSQYRRSAPESPEFVAALVARGQLYLLPPALNGEKARLDFQEALNTLPGRWDATLGLGRAQLVLEQADNAITTLTLALGAAAGPAEQAAVYLWRAQAYHAAGRLADEIADLKALSLLAEAPDLAPTAAARLTEIGPLASATPTASPSRTPAPSPSGRATATPVKRTTTATPTRTLTAAPATPTRAGTQNAYPAQPTAQPAAGYPAAPTATRKP